jgi:hypothetical protein
MLKFQRILAEWLGLVACFVFVATVMILSSLLPEPIDRFWYFPPGAAVIFVLWNSKKIPEWSWSVWLKAKKKLREGHGQL